MAERHGWSYVVMYEFRINNGGQDHGTWEEFKGAGAVKWAMHYARQQRGKVYRRRGDTLTLVWDHENGG